jgi:glycosyltransferase involved in cell wall biosynthesis
VRVLVLSQYYAPEPIPKPVELAEALRQRGHDVTVVTGIPNYPSGRLYPGYRLRPLRREAQDGVSVVRTFEYPYHGLRFAGRLVNYASFMTSAPLAAAVVRRADVIYVWHPPLTVGPAAWMLGRLCRAPFVYDVQDIWPDAAVEAGAITNPRVTRVLHRLERFVYRRAAHIITATAAARQNLVDKGVPSEKVSVLPHWIDVSAWNGIDPGYRRAFRRALGWDDDFVALFAGNIGVLQALDTVVHAMRHFGPDERFRAVIVGDGADLARIRALAETQGVERRVQFLDRRPAAEMPQLFAAADTLLVHLKRSPLAHWSLPTKTLAYLASGRPVIVAGEGPAAGLVEEAGAGIAVAPEQPEVLADAMRRIAGMSEGERAALGASGRRFARAHLSREQVIPQYEALLSSVAAGGFGNHL